MTHDHYPPGCKPNEVNIAEDDPEMVCCDICDEEHDWETMYHCIDCPNLCCPKTLRKCLNDLCDERICINCEDKQQGYCTRCLGETGRTTGGGAADEPQGSGSGPTPTGGGPLKITGRNR